MHNRTVIIREHASPLPPCYPEPLVYWLSLPDGYDDMTIKWAVAQERAKELDLPDDKLPAIADGITVDLVYPGHIAPTEDYRH